MVFVGRLLVLFLLFLLPGCGGGGSSSNNTIPPRTPSSVSGVVADGYLVGATVFSDRNGNKKWDDGEPKAVTGPGGIYTLEGDDLDLYPIVVAVDVNVIDEDTNSTVSKAYILSAPAGYPEFISPLTTIVQQQIERNPVLTVEDAEQVVKSSLGAASGVSLFEDYVSFKESNSEFATLHKIAQVVATTFGEVQEQLQSVATAAGYTPEDLLDALVDIVVQRVVERLSEIAVAVIESGDDFTPIAVAETVVAGINASAPVTVDTIGNEIEQVQTPAVASSFKTLLEGEGSHWFWADKWFNGSFEEYHLEYGIVSLNVDGETLDEVEYEYDFSVDRWVDSGPSQSYYLVDGEWVQVDDGAAGMTIVANTDGSITASDASTGQELVVYASEFDVSGKKMVSFIHPVFADFLADPAATFPAGAKAYQLSFKNNVDRYKAWQSTGINFDSMLTSYAKGSGNYLHLDRDLTIQFGAGDASVDIFERQNGDYVKRWVGTWEDRTVQGHLIRVINIPSHVLLMTDNEGPHIFIKWQDGTAWEGQYEWAGVLRTESTFDFNKAAFDAIMEKFNPTGYRFELPYIQYRTREIGDNRPYGWFNLLRYNKPIAPENIVAITVENVAGIEVSANIVPFYPRETRYDCRSEQCFVREIMQYSSYSIQNLPVDLPAGEYTIKVTTSEGYELREKVDYRGIISIPVVSTDMIYAKKIDGGFEFNWNLPTTEANWHLVDQIRLDITADNMGSQSRLMVMLNNNTGTMILPNSILLQAGLDPESTSLFWVFQARALDGLYNYSRSLSDIRRIDGVYWPLKEIGSGFSSNNLPLGMESVDFSYVDVIIDDLNLEVTMGLKGDFVNATTGLEDDYFALGMWIDFDDIDKWTPENSGNLVIDQNLDGRIFGRIDNSEEIGYCSSFVASNSVTEDEIYEIKFELSWEELGACGITPDSTVRFWTRGYDMTDVYPDRFFY